jgi:hypothetical protein
MHGGDILFSVQLGNLILDAMKDYLVHGKAVTPAVCFLSVKRQ